MPLLDVVVPVYNERLILPELAERLGAVVTSLAPRGRVLLVDDGSSDGSGTLLRGFGPPIVPVPLAFNQGQFGATQAGLRASTAPWVAVLDGDLQDPPEALASMWALAQRDPTLDAVFACKHQRAEGRRFRALRWLYQRALEGACAHPVPEGLGSYTLMRASLARQIAELPAQRLNLGGVLATLGPRYDTVTYVKEQRYDDNSRVGWKGLAREALQTLYFASQRRAHDHHHPG